MTLLNTINVGGTDYGITGAAVLGSCATPAGSEIKVCTFSDSFELKAGDMLSVKFTYANTYGDGSTTYPKLQVNSTNYAMRRADGNYLRSGEWGSNTTLVFLFDGTDFVLNQLVPVGTSPQTLYDDADGNITMQTMGKLVVFNIARRTTAQKDYTIPEVIVAGYSSVPLMTNGKVNGEAYFQNSTTLRSELTGEVSSNWGAGQLIGFLK